MNLKEFGFVEIAGGSYELGWRFDDRLGPEAWAGIDEFLPRESFFQRFSKRREVELAPFAMATQAIALEALMEELMGPGADEAYEEALDGLEGLADFCAFVDGHLRHHGLRLATEDELEAACGPGLFVWGDALPDGSPHETRFEGHRQANGVGLRFNHDPYAGELTRCAVKLGDGGESICGGYPWPVAWMALAPSYRLVGADIDEYFFEFIEVLQARLVRLEG